MVLTYWYAKAFVSVFNKEIDWNSDTIKGMLHTVSYVPNQDTHDYQNDLTNELSTANGYTAGGLTLTTPTSTTSTNVHTLDTDNPQWTATGAGFTARIITISDSTPGTAATNPLILWSDFEANETASGGGTFTYQVNASGWATNTAANAAGFP